MRRRSLSWRQRSLSLRRWIAHQLRRLDGIVHCAAAFDGLSPLSLQTIAQWQQLLRLNTIVPFALDRACETLLRAAPGASVVLIGETHGQAPAAYWGGFAVSKAALAAYAQIRTEEWADAADPRLNLLIPGPMNSPQRAKSHPGEAKAGLPQPEQVATAVLYLLGPDSAGLRGARIELDAAC